MRRSSALAGVLVLIAACGGASPSSPTPADLEAIELTPTHTITVDEGGFDPPALEVAAGQVIRLVNDGRETHSFTATDRFDTGRLEPGEDTTLVLIEPGEITFKDVTDPGHEGTLTIVAAPATQ